MDQFIGTEVATVPRPSQAGQAPNGLLNENNRGSRSPTARSQSDMNVWPKIPGLDVHLSSG